MSEPGGGWASPGARPPASPGAGPVQGAPQQQDPQQPAPQQPGPQQPAPQQPDAQQPAWQGQAGWGAPPQAPGQPPQQGWGAQQQYGQQQYAQQYGAPQQYAQQYGAPQQYGQQQYGQQSGQQYGQQWGGQPGWGAPAAPSPRPGVVPLRPLGLGELLDGAVALVRRYPRPVLAVSALVAATSTMLQVLLLTTALQPLFEIDTLALESGDVDQLLGIAAGAGVASAVTLVFSTLTNAVMGGLLTVVAGRGVLGQSLTLAELWQAVRPKLGRLLRGSLLVSLAVYGPFVLAVALTGVLGGLLLAPGFVVGGLAVVASLVFAVLAYVRLAFAPSVVVLEDAGVTASLKRSWRLVKGSTWRVLGILLLAFVVSSVVSQVLQFPLALLGGGGPFALDESGGLSSTSLLLSTVGAGLAAVVVVPFTAGVTALLYVDRRMRAEGLDVALQAAAAEQR